MADVVFIIIVGTFEVFALLSNKQLINTYIVLLRIVIICNFDS